MGKREFMNISGVIIQPLKQIADERGKVMHMLRRDSGIFSGFGEVYFSLIYCGKIKAWKRHMKMTQHFAVPVGKVKLVIYDGREDSATYKEIQVINLGEGNYVLVKIPPLLWYGFMGLSTNPALIVNCADMPHNPEESEGLEAGSKLIPFFWGEAK